MLGGAVLPPCALRLNKPELAGSELLQMSLGRFGVSNDGNLLTGSTANRSNLKGAPHRLDFDNDIGVRAHLLPCLLHYSLPQHAH